MCRCHLDNVTSLLHRVEKKLSSAAPGGGAGGAGAAPVAPESKWPPGALRRAARVVLIGRRRPARGFERTKPRAAADPEDDSPPPPTPTPWDGRPAKPTSPSSGNGVVSDEGDTIFSSDEAAGAAHYYDRRRRRP